MTNFHYWKQKSKCQVWKYTEETEKNYVQILDNFTISFGSSDFNINQEDKDEYEILLLSSTSNQKNYVIN